MIANVPLNRTTLEIVKHDFSVEIRDARSIARAFGLAESTARKYLGEYRHFQSWAKANEIVAMPALPRTILAYLQFRIEECGSAQATIERIRSAISLAHDVYFQGVMPDDAHVANPAQDRMLLRALKGLQIAHPRLRTQKTELRYTDLTALIGHVPSTLIGKRDRALLALTWFGAMRRSEVVSLNVADLEWQNDVLILHLRTSKTDQTGKGQSIPIARLPGAISASALLREWLNAAHISSGPIFRWLHAGKRVGTRSLSGQSVWAIVKSYCAAAGLDPTLFGAHSLRSGLATELAVSEVDLLAIMDHCRWTSAATARKYIRRASDLAGGATARLKIGNLEEQP